MNCVAEALAKFTACEEPDQHFSLPECDPREVYAVAKQDCVGMERTCDMQSRDPDEASGPTCCVTDSCGG